MSTADRLTLFFGLLTAISAGGNILQFYLGNRRNRKHAEHTALLQATLGLANMQKEPMIAERHSVRSKAFDLLSDVEKTMVGMNIDGGRPMEYTQKVARLGQWRLTMEEHAAALDRISDPSMDEWRSIGSQFEQLPPLWNAADRAFTHNKVNRRNPNNTDIENYKAALANALAAIRTLKPKFRETS
ncbi:MAG: hypothetical protein ABI432_03205 [Flavobacteriales bacterium]